MGLGAPSNLAARGRTLQEPADVRQRATSRTRLGSTHEWRLRRTHHASTDNAVCVQAIAASILRSTFAVPGIIGPGAWAREPGWRASYSFACQPGTAGSGADVDRLTACRLRGRVTIVEGRRACATVAVVDRGPENCGGDVCRVGRAAAAAATAFAGSAWAARRPPGRAARRLSLGVISVQRRSRRAPTTRRGCQCVAKASPA